MAIELTIGYVLANILYHFLDIVQLDLRGRSGTRQEMRIMLLERWLGMDQDDRMSYNRQFKDVGSFQECLETKVEEAVADGWYQVYVLTQNIAYLIFAVIYTAIMKSNIAIGERFMRQYAQLDLVGDKRSFHCRL